LTSPLFEDHANAIAVVRVQETLPQEILTKMHAPAKPSFPIITPEELAKYDAFLTGLTEVHGGSPWGAGTYAASDGSRQPTALELEVATIQGKAFYGVVSKVKF
jgi:multimeric flavodoxin WrbA